MQPQQTRYNLRTRTEEQINLGLLCQGQRTLRDLGKVVVLAGSTAHNFKTEDLLRCKAVLEDDSSTADDSLKSLHELSIYQVTKEHLHQTQVGATVRRLKASSDVDIARVAHNLVEKWKTELHRQKHAHSRQLGTATLVPGQQQHLPGSCSDSLPEDCGEVKPVSKPGIKQSTLPFRAAPPVAQREGHTGAAAAAGAGDAPLAAETEGERPQQRMKNPSSQQAAKPQNTKQSTLCWNAAVQT